MTGAPRAGLEMKLRSLKLPSFVAHHSEVAGRAMAERARPASVPTQRVKGLARANLAS